MIRETTRNRCPGNVQTIRNSLLVYVVHVAAILEMGLRMGDKEILENLAQRRGAA